MTTTVHARTQTVNTRSHFEAGKILFIFRTGVSVTVQHIVLLYFRKIRLRNVSYAVI
jgi:hypothetical protein